MSHQTAFIATPTVPARRLLACGVIAGPLFVAVALIQAFTREGFDLARHPISLLSLGDLGWVQIANFVATGALYVACAVGLRRSLRPGRGGTWGPRFVGALGVGLIVAGVFVTDAGAGFPPGAPAGAPEQISWRGVVHEIGFIVAMLSGTVVCFLFARRYAALKKWGWVGACVVTPVVALGLSFWPDMNGLSVRLVIATGILLGFVAVFSARVRAALPDALAASRSGRTQSLTGELA
jgi:Protein of unknown function (DUF998)